MDHKFTYENLKDFFGQDPSLDTVIRLLGDTEDQGDGNSSGSVDWVGIDVTKNGIDLIDLSDPDEPVQFGAVRLFNDTDLFLVRHYLKAYLLTNEDVLSKPERNILNRLIRLF